jgi:hypothetical protein
MKLKTLTTILILVCCGQVAIGQIFTLSEMILLNDKDTEEFDTFVTKKNYSYFDTKTSDYSEKVSYNYERDNFSTKATYWISKTSVSWQTNYQKHYLSFKTQLKASGYKVFKTGTFNGALYTEYRKGKIEVTLFSINTENETGGKDITYEISVGRLR